jgi:adenylate cyclase
MISVVTDLPALPPIDSAASDGLDAALLARVTGLRDWLLTGAAKAADAGEVLSGFAERLNGLGVPVDRIFTVIEALHSEYAGIGRSWTPEEGAAVRFLPHGERRETVYRTSPFAHVNQTGEWLLLDLDTTADDLFPVIPELKAGGYRHHLTVPIHFAIGAENGISFATRNPAGFGEQGLKILRLVLPTFAAVTELRAVSKRLDDVLRIYVGDEPHREILGGAIRRGQVSRIRSAMLFADMRGYTRLSSNLEPEETVALLNTFFDCLVPPIEAAGGEVLKYMGDGLLAIFRDRGDDTGGSSHAALAAARQAHAQVEALDRSGTVPGPIGLGIALHHGEAAYGNVGSGSRLDFTVIGCDVNLASRIGRLNRVLDEPILMSKSFADHLWDIPDDLGRHALEGFDEPVRLYRPRRA